MTILFLTRLFYPHIGGVEKHVYQISKQMIKKGHQVIVITENHGWKKKEIIDGILTYRIDVGENGKNKKFRIWNELWKLKDIIASVDIVHAHDVFFWYLPFRYLYWKKPVFTTFHGYEGNNLPTRKAIFMHKLAEKLSYGNICVGDFLRKWYKTKPTYVIYGGVDKKLILEGNKVSYAKKDIIFIGRLEEETGITEYLQTILLLKQKHIPLTLDIYGDGSLKKYCQQFVKKNNLAVTFHGFDHNVTGYLYMYQYVFTSRYLGILEAMAMQKIVFAQYNNEIKKDYLTMTPFANYIIIKKTSKELAQEVSEYLDKPLRQKEEIKQAYQWTKKQSWEKISLIYLKLWNLDLNSDKKISTNIT